MKKLLLLIIAFGSMVAQAQEIDAVSVTQNDTTDWYMLADNEDVISVTVNSDGVIFPGGKSYSYANGIISTAFGIAPKKSVYKRIGLNDGDLGTICLPWKAENITGGTFYAPVKCDSVQSRIELAKVAIDEIVPGTSYVFQASDTSLVITYYDSTAVDVPIENNGLIGNFEEDAYIPEGAFFVLDNMVQKAADGTNKLGVYYAYFSALKNIQDKTSGLEPSIEKLYINISTPTELGKTEGESNSREVRKEFRNGRLFIICDGVVYDAKGILVQE